MTTVDAILLRRQGELDRRVLNGLEQQHGVTLLIHPVHVDHRLSDALNQAKRLCRHPWVLVVDDSIRLEDACTLRLLEVMRKRPHCAAVCARISPDHRRAPHDRDKTGLFATLFRRKSLEMIRFRSAVGRSVFECCSQDLRRQSWGVSDCPNAVGVRHSLPVRSPTRRTILTAFDQNHFHKFQARFLKSLRESKNRDRVIAVTHGLDPSNERTLAKLSNLEIWPVNKSSLPTATQRLGSFQPALRSLPHDSLVAYWDAADMLFQTELSPLWHKVEQSPHRLHVSSESRTAISDEALRGWIGQVTSSAARDWLRRISSGQPFINAGFAAGSASSLLTYCELGQRIRHTPLLAGTGGWDQMAMNVLYWYFQPDLFHLTEDQWNFCLHGRDNRETIIRGRRIYRTSDGSLIPVVHGNGKSLESFWAAHERTNYKKLSVKSKPRSVTAQWQ